jgi:hypothetical protein
VINIKLFSTLKKLQHLMRMLWQKFGALFAIALANKKRT